VLDGETGWLNHSLSGTELGQLMASAIDRPDDIGRLRACVRDHRDAIVTSMSSHVDEVDVLYGELLSAEPVARGDR
jgi:hypothetical protein